MAKEVVKKEPTASSESDAEIQSGDAPAKQGFVKKLLGNRKMLMIVGGGALVVVLGASAGGYFLLSGHGPKANGTKVAAADEPLK